MDRAKLKQKLISFEQACIEQELENFKQACIKQGCIDEDKEYLIVEESFPGMQPTSFIVNVLVRNEWLKDKSHRDALEELEELLYKTTDEQTLKNILTIRLCFDATASANDENYPFETMDTSLKRNVA